MLSSILAPSLRLPLVRHEKQFRLTALKSMRNYSVRCEPSFGLRHHHVKPAHVMASAVTMNGAAPTSAAGKEAHPDVPIKARVVTVVPADSKSRVGRGMDVTWEEVMAHEAVRLRWTDPGLQMLVFTDRMVQDVEERAAFEQAVLEADVFLATDIWSTPAMELLLKCTGGLRTAVFMDCAPPLAFVSRLDGIKTLVPSDLDKLLSWIPGTSSQKAFKLWANLKDFWSRGTSDDILYTFLVLIDSYVVKLNALANLRGQGLGNIACMVGNCRQAGGGLRHRPHLQSRLGLPPGLRAPLIRWAPCAASFA
eukprot:jgi/Botrbrau1/1505/Bobra.178_3s0057.1